MLKYWFYFESELVLCASVCVECDCCQNVVVSVKDDNKHVSMLPDITQ